MSDLLSPADQHIRHSHCSSQFKPPTHSQSMVLIGMNPAEDCLLAAQQRGMQFWETQVSKQLCDQKHKAENVQQELQELHRNYDEKIITLSSNKASLKEECCREGTVEDDDVQHGTSKPFASTEPITSDHNNKLYNAPDENPMPYDATVISTVRKHAKPISLYSTSAPSLI